jgi:hypothetical protein
MVAQLLAGFSDRDDPTVMASEKSDGDWTAHVACIY